MGQRRTNRGPAPRTDRDILGHGEDLFLLEQIEHGRVQMGPEHRMALRRLEREDLCTAGFPAGSPATLLPRGRRLLQVVRGELPAPTDLD